MQRDNRRPVGPCSALAAQRWPQVRLLKDVRGLNEHVLAVLSGDGRNASGPSGDVAELHGLWRALDAESRRRAAQMPFLLLDLRFQDVEWWQAMRASGDLACSEARDAGREATWQSQLTRQALMLAWAAARGDGLSASLLFGMAQPVAEIIGSLAPQRIDLVGQLVCPAMRLRFSHSENFWRRLVTAAGQNDSVALREVHLYGLRLLGGEVLRSVARSYDGGVALCGTASAARSRRVISPQVVSTD